MKSRGSEYALTKVMVYICKPSSPENVSWNCRFNQVRLNYDFEPILWWVLLLECAQRVVWLLFCFNPLFIDTQPEGGEVYKIVRNTKIVIYWSTINSKLNYNFFPSILNTFWYSSATYLDFIQFLANSHPPNVYFWISYIFSNLLTILYV